MYIHICIYIYVHLRLMYTIPWNLIDNTSAQSWFPFLSVTSHLNACLDLINITIDELTVLWVTLWVTFLTKFVCNPYLYMVSVSSATWNSNTSPTVNHNNNGPNNNGPNGHLFYVGDDLMMRRGMLPIIMLPDGDLRIVLHLVPFWILTIWGSVHIEESVVRWRKQLRMKTSAT